MAGPGPANRLGVLPCPAEMDRLRAFVRLLAAVGLTLGSYACLLAILPLRRPAPARHLRLRNAVFRTWGRGLAGAVGMRVTVRGEPPAGAFFLVANHLSYMDIILLGAHVDGAFVAKADLRGWPIAGLIISAADTIFIDRSRRRDLVRVMERIEDALGRGLGVVVFAEGTTSPGQRILPLKASILELAVRAERPVHHATISYRLSGTGLTAGETICWWGDAAFLPHFWRLARLPGFEARLNFGHGAIAAGDRKHLASSLHAAMSADFEPVD